MTYFNFKADWNNQRLVITSNEPNQAKIFYSQFRELAKKNGFSKTIEYNEATEEVYFKSGAIETIQSESKLSINQNSPGTYLGNDVDSRAHIWFGDSELKNMFLLYFNGLQEANESKGAMFYFNDLSRNDINKILSFELNEYRPELKQFATGDWLENIKAFFAKLSYGIIQAFQFMKNWFNEKLNLFFKNPEIEALKNALENYTKTVNVQQDELIGLNTALTYCQEQYISLINYKNLELEKAKEFLSIRNNASNDLCAVGTKKIGEEDRMTKLSEINRLLTSYPKLPDEYISHEVSEIERQRIEHHEELKTLLENYIKEYCETINLEQFQKA